MFVQEQIFEVLLLPSEKKGEARLAFRKHEFKIELRTPASDHLLLLFERYIPKQVMSGVK